MIHSAGAGVNTPARIPFAFRADPVALDGLDLDATARAAFVLILDNAKSRGWRSRLSNSTIGRILGRCPMTISRALGRLEAAGLILRELAAGGRIRTGILVTWEGVRREGRTGSPSVRREDLTGPALASEGLGARAELIRSDIQSRDQAGPPPSIEEDSEEAARLAELGPARYLRMCIEAGRRGGGPAVPTSSPGGGADKPTPLPTSRGMTVSPPASTMTSTAVVPATVDRVVLNGGSTPEVSQDDVRREVERMAGLVFKDARRAAWGPPPGRRRMTPAELQRQLAEVRRKYGRRS